MGEFPFICTALICVTVRATKHQWCYTPTSYKTADDTVVPLMWKLKSSYKEPVYSNSLPAHSRWLNANRCKVFPHFPYRWHYISPLLNISPAPAIEEPLTDVWYRHDLQEINATIWNKVWTSKAETPATWIYPALSAEYTSKPSICLQRIILTALKRIAITLIMTAQCSLILLP